jgi:hypothetical protein
MKKILIRTTILGTVLLFVSFAAAEITVTVTGPEEGVVLAPCNGILLKADVQTTAGETIKDVKFYVNGSYRKKVRSAPWEYTWKKIKSGAYVVAAMATDMSGNEVWSEPIRFKAGRVSSGEKMKNSSFDCGTLSPWMANIGGTAKAKYTVMDDAYFDDENYLYIDIQAISSETWHIQLNQAMKTDSGHVYEISFLADADNIKPIILIMQENKDPWEEQWNQVVEIDGINEYGPYIFEATKTDLSNIFIITLGADETDCYFDDFRIIDRSATSVAARNLSWTDGPVSEFELFQAYPNPFNMDTTIRFKLSDRAGVVVAVYNMQGQKVRTLVHGEQSAGEHRVVWNGLDDAGRVVPSGVYVYRLHAEGQNRPVDLSRKVLLLK